MKYETIRFGDLYTIPSRNGLSKPSKVRGSGYKMINMGELFSNDRIYDIQMELVPLKDNEKINAKIEKGDLLFARQSLVLEGAGKCIIVMETSPLTVFESHLIRVRLIEDANPMFYYYYFRSPLSPVKTIVSQCAQAGIRGSDLQELQVLNLPRYKQDKIANILSAYDDLIENNQKQIKLLEEAAQRLYKEWFVDLHFPGYEDTEIIDGVPEGWSKRCVSDFGEVITGKTPSTAKTEYYGGHIPFVTIPDMHGQVFPLTTEKALTKAGADTQKGKYLPKNTVIVSCIATVGLVNIATETCQTNQQINSIMPYKGHVADFVYSILEHYAPQIASIAGNQAVPIINKTLFSSVSLLMPKENEQQKIADCLSSVDELISTETAKLDQLKAHKKGLMQQLFPKLQ